MGDTLKQHATLLQDDHYGTYALQLGLGSVDDTATIQAALTAARLAGGGYIRGMPGQTYTLSAIPVIGSNTTLDLTGCTWQLKSGTQVNLLNNYAFTAATTVMDGAITTGTATLACATSTPFGPFSVGDSVWVWGAGRQGSILKTTISAKTNTGHVTLADNALTTVAGATVTVGPRDRDIRIIGGTWSRNGNSAGNNTQGDVIRLRRVDGVTIVGPYFPDGTGFHDICLGDCTDFTVKRPTIAVTTGQTDLVHLHGPLDGGRIEDVRGYGTSCFVSLCPNDYAASNDVYGFIDNITIDGVHASPGNVSLLVGVIEGNAGVGARHIRIKNINGPTSSNQGLVYIGLDTASANTQGGLIDDVTIDGIVPNLAATSPAAVAMNPTNAKKIRVSGLAPQADYPIDRLVKVTAGHVESLTVSDVVLPTFTGTPPDIVGVDSATVDSCKIRDVQGGSFGYLLATHSSTSVVTRTVIANVQVTGKGSILFTSSSPASTPNVDVTNMQVAGSPQSLLGSISNTVEMHVANYVGAASAQYLCVLNPSAVLTLQSIDANFQGKAPSNSGGTLFGWNRQAILAAAGLTSTYYAYPAATGPVSQSIGTGFLRFAPLIVPVTTSFDRIGLEIVTGGGAGALVRLGIYASTVGGLPGPLLLDAGTIDSSAAGWQEIVISQALAPGMYWLVACSQVAASTIRTATGVSIPQTAQATYAATYRDTTGGYTAALPTAPAGLTNSTVLPLIGLRVA